MNNTNMPVKRRGCFRNSCLGFIIILVLLGGALCWAFRSSHTLPDRFVLSIPLGGTISEIRHESSSLPFVSSRESLSLQELLFILNHAATDERVREVVLDIGGGAGNSRKDSRASTGG